MAASAVSKATLAALAMPDRRARTIWSGSLRARNVIQTILVASGSDQTLDIVMDLASLV
jgi:hypothetical protein